MCQDYRNYRAEEEIRKLLEGETRGSGERIQEVRAARQETTEDSSPAFADN